MEDFKGDKRTKEYKEWKRKFDNRGVGDKLETLIAKTGLDKLMPDDCGCKERKEILNKLFGKKNVKCLEIDEYDYLKEVFATKGKISVETQSKMKEIHERVFSVKLISNCLSCSFIKEIYRPLRKIYDNY